MARSTVAPTMSDDTPNLEAFRSLIVEAVDDQALRTLRRELITYSADVFDRTGRVLELEGHLIGPDRQTRVSPFGHGSDEVAAIGFLLRVLHQLVAGAGQLFASDLPYAASALVRQAVEVEYLAWAFDTRDRDAERWLRSDKAIRQIFFSPRKLREASVGKFRGQDYGHHCELGGHPTPTGRALMYGNDHVSEMMIVDLLGHAGRTWDHLLSWSVRFPHGHAIQLRREEMLRRFVEWKRRDPLVNLPQTP